LADLLNIDTALEQILKDISPLPGEQVAIEQALGRVLAQDIYADANLPPFANSSVDGYAVHAADIAQASQDNPVSLRVTMDIPAGSAPNHAVGAMLAARIMTGAPLPDGADAVVPVENTDSNWRGADNVALPAEVAIYATVSAGANVRPAGEDVQAGQRVLSAGTILRPQDIGVLAALGHSRVPAFRQPRVVILSTGDELVGVDEPLTPGKIRDSNSYTLAGLVATYGGIPIRLPTARDTLDDVRQLFKNALAQSPDIVLSSAGVSVGAFDVVRTVLDELGKVGFWRVNLRPGKPLAFGHLQGVPFFGLPGNPVSAMVTFEVFVRPVLLKLTGRQDEVMMAVATVGQDIHSDGRRSFLRVKLSRENGRLIAQLTGTQSSGALMSMVLADGLLIVPENVTHVSAGEQLPVRLLRDFSE
jgi:molybdopterin molybdotransferase